MLAEGRRMSDKLPLPTIDADQIVTPAPPRPQESVGSEGGASLIGTPRRVETDTDNDERKEESE
jgi:hypothetical protein